MQESIEFQKHINAAINCYLRARRGKKLSRERLTDIANIKRIIGGALFDYRKPKKTITKYLKKMRTGWFIFQAGNSNLKKSIQEEIKKFKNSHTKTFISPNGKVPMKESENPNARSQSFGFFSPNGNTSIQENKSNINTNKNTGNYLFGFVK